MKGSEFMRKTFWLKVVSGNVKKAGVIGKNFRYFDFPSGLWAQLEAGETVVVAYGNSGMIGEAGIRENGEKWSKREEDVKAIR